MKRITTLFFSLAVLTAVVAPAGLARPDLVAAQETAAPGAIVGPADLYGLTSPLVAATESITDNIPAIQGGFVTVPVVFSKSGNQLTSLVSELHYDVSKLQPTLGPDSGGLRTVQSVSFPNLPATYIGGAFVKTGAESDIEVYVHLDPALASNPPVPLPQIPDGILANIVFRAIASAPVNTPVTFELIDPPPSAGVIDGTSLVAGVTTDPGSVNISPAVQIMNLVPGFNLVGLSVVPQVATPAAVFGSLGSNLKTVHRYVNPTGYQVYDPSIPPFLNTLTTTPIESGYWVKVDVTATLNITGVLPTYPVNIPVGLGFNLIAYPSPSNVALPGALNASIAGKWRAVFGEPFPFKVWDVTIPPFLNTLLNMGPGKGYWLDVTTVPATVVVSGP